MKTRTVTFCKLLLAALVLTFNSCQDDSADTFRGNTTEKLSFDGLKKELIQPTSQDLPQKVQEQLALSKANLAANLNNGLQITQVSVLGKLSSEKSLLMAQNLVSAPESAIASGNIKNPASVIIGKMQNVQTGKELSSTQNNLKALATHDIKAGDDVLQITWNHKGQQLTTLCFYTNEGIIWDNILGGLVMMDANGTIQTSDNTSKVASRWYKQWWTADWIWGSQRGEIGYQITIYYSGSTVSNTDVNDWGNMSLGSARSESKITKNTGSYGQCRYALGLCTPTGSLSFSYSSFSVSFSGLGSNIVSNGYKSLYP
ncbi:hypothetical protein [Flavobacterium humi]|uniref:Lipoprotein n=1 Tax=Flavobacterium humi TaxID=2562683 RepID=A0A4Z0LBF7_9FLAO|nr:hypothetical protein [Flavobacterium humi]TGD58906.1 hypothetical protein E4635_03380 [Flavobacterium humi]